MFTICIQRHFLGHGTVLLTEEWQSAQVPGGEQLHFILQSRFSFRSRRRSGGWRDRVNGEDWRWSKINKSSCTSSSTSSSTSRSRSSSSSGVMWWCCWLNWCCWVLVCGRQRNVITRSVDGIHLSHAVLWGSISRENTLSLAGRWDAGDFFLRRRRWIITQQCGPKQRLLYADWGIWYYQKGSGVGSRAGKEKESIQLIMIVRT